MQHQPGDSVRGSVKYVTYLYRREDSRFGEIATSITTDIYVADQAEARPAATQPGIDQSERKGSELEINVRSKTVSPPCVVRSRHRPCRAQCYPRNPRVGP